LRGLMSRLGAAPPSDAPEPVLHLVDHLQAVFPQAACPIEAFHVRFQRSLLA